MKPDQQRIACYAVILREQQILLCRLAPHTSSPGQWTLPGGGLNYGEHPDEGVIREVREETGFEVEIESLLAMDSELFEYQSHRMHAVRIIYRACVTGGELRNELDESTDRCQWFPLEEVFRLRTVPLVRTAAELIR